MGLALDPEFANTGRLYVCYTMSKRGSLVNRLSVLIFRAGQAGDEHVLVDDMPGAGVHDGCRVKFGPDGKLYFTMGDAAESRLAQLRDTLAGKILRLNGDGSVPADNPFPRSPIYSLGHRNPQGLAWDAAGRLYASEHGPSGFPGGHDELNLIRPGSQLRVAGGLRESRAGGLRRPGAGVGIGGRGRRRASRSSAAPPISPPCGGSSCCGSAWRPMVR